MLRRAGPCRADVCSLFLVSNASLSYCLCVCWENLGSMLLETRLIQQNLLLAVGGWLLRAKHALRGQDNGESSKSLWYNATVSWHDVGVHPVHPCNGITWYHNATSSNLPLPLPSWYLDHENHEPPVAFSVNSCKTRASRGVCRRYEQGSLDLPGLQKWDASQPSNYLELSRTWTNTVITWTAPHAPRELPLALPWHAVAGQLWYKMGAFQISS